MTRVIVSKYDSADYLKTEEDFAEYLAAAAEGGDAAHFARALVTVARASNMSAFARESGLTREGGLFKAFSGYGNPTLDATMSVLSALGLEFTVKVVQPAKPAARKRTERAPRI